MAKKTEKLELKALEIRRLTLEIESISPLMQHRFAAKAGQIGGAKVGEDAPQRKKRDLRDPDREAAERVHTFGDGRFGIPTMAIKAAMISAAHKDIGIEKTLIRSNLFLESDGVDSRCGTQLVEIDQKKYVIDEQAAKNANGAPDMRYRPRFDHWRATLRFTYVSDRINATQIATLVQRAGFTCGVGEKRPTQNGGDFGRWKLVEG